MRARTMKRLAYAGIFAGGVAFGIPRSAAGKLPGAALSFAAFAALARAEDTEELTDGDADGGPQGLVERDPADDARKPQGKGAEVPEKPDKGAGAKHGHGDGHALGGDLMLGGEDVPLAGVRVADEAALTEGTHVVRRDPANAGRAGGAGEEKAEESALALVHAPIVAEATLGRKNDGENAGEQDREGGAE